jgi:HK97 family phage portal protein
MKAMRFGSTLARIAKSILSPVDNRGGWFSLWGAVKEAFAGAWQENVVKHRHSAIHYAPVFSCITLIAGDISNMEWCMRQWDDDNQIWKRSPKQVSAQYLPVLRKPNNYQNQNQFREVWMLSKLQHGNTYGLIVRDQRGMVKEIYILDPTRVTPMVVDETGEVWYQLSPDNMTGGMLQNGIMVPASEIIHDRFNCLFHPLVGISPIFACLLQALQGIKVQENYYTFFKNGAQPSGILTAPGSIPVATAAKLKQQFNEGFTGDNAGKTAVLADGLKYQPITMSATDSQAVELLKFGEQQICSTFHVPQYKIGSGSVPAGMTVEQLAQDYLTGCLLRHIEDMEAVFNEALGLDDNNWVHLDQDNLLRLDKQSQMTFVSEGIKASVLAPDDGRRYFNLPPVPGGAFPMAQQQNYSLEALAKRDASDDPFRVSKPESVPDPTVPPGSPNGGGTQGSNGEDENADEQRQAEFFTKAMESFDLEMAA